MRKDFKNLDIYAAFQPVNGAEWEWNTWAMLPGFLLICVVRTR